MIALSSFSKKYRKFNVVIVENKVNLSEKISDELLSVLFGKDFCCVSMSFLLTSGISNMKQTDCKWFLS